MGRTNVNLLRGTNPNYQSILYGGVQDTER